MARNQSWLFLIPLAGLVGCSNPHLSIALTGGSNVPTQEIETIQKEPETGNTVYIQGEVKQQAPFLESGAYQLEDQTGKIWITTDKNLPTVGEEIVVKGKVQYQSIPISEEDWGEVYIQELRHFSAP